MLKALLYFVFIERTLGLVAGGFSLYCNMRPNEKIFINKEPNDDDLDVIKELLKKHDLKKYIPHSFIYINITDEETIEILKFPDGAVYKIMKEYSLQAKQAVQMIYYDIEIVPSVKELQYWSSINEYRKYIPVVAEATMKSGVEKVYADFAIYAKDLEQACMNLIEMDFEEYLYLEDVDE